MLDVLSLDIYMQSPPASPSWKQVEHSNTSLTIDLQGASHTTGGILHGQAQGNVFNNADADPVLDYGLEHCIGQIQVYTSHTDPAIVKPNMELKHEVTSKLTKVLQVLSCKHSSVWSMVFNLYLDMLNFYVLFF